MTTRGVYWRIFQTRPRLFVLDLFLQLLRSGLPLVPSLIILVLFNRLAAHYPMNSSMWVLLALLVGAALARVSALLVCLAYDGVAEATAITALTRSALAAILRRPGADRPGRSTGDLVNHITGDSAVVSSTLGYALMAFGSGAQALAAIAIMLWINPLITVVVCVPMIGAGLLINRASRRIKQYHRESRAAAGEVSSFLAGMFHGVAAIQLAGTSAPVMERLAELSEIRRGKSLRSMLFTDLFLSSIWTNTAALGTGVVLILTAHSLTTGAFTVGDLAVFIMYVGWVTDFTSVFSQSLVLYKQAAASLERLEEAIPGAVSVLEAEPAAEPAAAPPPRAGLVMLEVSGVTYEYPGTGKGVKDIGFTVRRGEFVVVTGRVGAGKTTLLRAVLGLLPRQAGSVRWNGHDISELVPPLTAYTPQVPRLVSESVADNIRAGLDAADDELLAAVRAAVLEDDVAALQDGLATLVGPRGARLSGGQVQRVAAARMFLRRPELLVFDDISSALDVRTERELWERLLAGGNQATGQATGQATCLAVSHRRAAFERATRIVVVEDGRITAEGTLAELLRDSAEVRYLWASELAEEVSGEPAMAARRVTTEDAL
jgi:ATP-binding cassette subfamily B protein